MNKKRYANRLKRVNAVLNDLLNSGGNFDFVNRRRAMFRFAFTGCWNDRFRHSPKIRQEVHKKPFWVKSWHKQPTRFKHRQYRRYAVPELLFDDGQVTVYLSLPHVRDTVITVKLALCPASADEALRKAYAEPERGFSPLLELSGAETPVLCRHPYSEYGIHYDIPLPVAEFAEEDALCLVQALRGFKELPALDTVHALARSLVVGKERLVTEADKLEPLRIEVLPQGGMPVSLKYPEHTLGRLAAAFNDETCRNALLAQWKRDLKPAQMMWAFIAVHAACQAVCSRSGGEVRLWGMTAFLDKKEHIRNIAPYLPVNVRKVLGC